MTTIALRPAWSAAPTPFKHTWEGLVNIDQFRWLVRKDCLDQLKQAHDELGARHVRAVGMFCDEMRVIGPTPTSFGKKETVPPRVNWQVVDYAIDELLAIGINPMFTTTFMPSTMASGDMTVFSTKSRTSPPKDYQAWEDFVSAAVQHQVDRHGRDIVKNWYFEVWNEPNLSPPFFEGKKPDFFKLWTHAWRAVKRVDESFQIGGPSTARAEWMAEFVEYGRKNGCPADYIIGHCYNNDSAFGALSPFDGPQGDRENNSPHFLPGVVRGVKQLLDQLGFKGQVHWNEWGRSWYPYDEVRESVQEAAFVAKTLAEVSQLGDYFAYWNLSDIYDQVGYGAETFHGNYGMLNLQGLRKPNYQTHQLLSRLGHQRVAVEGSGIDLMVNAIATTSEKGQQVLVYALGETDLAATTTRQVEVRLPAAGRVTLHRLGSRDNNILTAWRDIGAPAYLTAALRRDLHAANALMPSTPPVVTTRPDGVWASFTMECPGVALLEVRGA